METKSRIRSRSAICNTDHSKTSSHRGIKRRRGRPDSGSVDRKLRQRNNCRSRRRRTVRRWERWIQNGGHRNKSPSAGTSEYPPPRKRHKTRRVNNARSRTRKAERRARFLESKREENRLMCRRLAIKRRREMSVSTPPPPKRSRTSDHMTYVMGRARMSVKRAAVIVKKWDKIRAERERAIERAARLEDEALMRRVMSANPSRSVRDPRISALAARLGGTTNDDYLYVKAQVEQAPWAVYVDPFTRSTLHRLCAMEGGDN